MVGPPKMGLLSLQKEMPELSLSWPHEQTASDKTIRETSPEIICLRTINFSLHNCCALRLWPRTSSLQNCQKDNACEWAQSTAVPADTDSVQVL